MKARRKGPKEEAAFVMGEGDLFHRIIVSDGVRYESDPDAETVITFFVIRRASGLFEICNVNRTFLNGKTVSRTVQGKKDIPAERIADEIDSIRIFFALAIEKATGYKLRWNELDLSEVEDQAEQVARIRAWGRVGVRVAADIPPIGPD